MGAKCCASEAAAGERRDRAFEALNDGGVQVDTADTLEGKPLWLLEHEEAMCEEKQQLAKEQPPLPPPEMPPSNPSKGSEPETAPPAPEGEAAAPKAKARSGPKARARSKAREGAQAKAAAKPPEGANPPAKAPQPAPAEEPAAEEAASKGKPAMGGILYRVMRITIVSARGLRNADSSPGKSDPYVVCEIPGKSSSKFKTKVMKDTLNPAWHHKVEMSGFGNADSLMFSVYDKDMLTADDLIGKAVLKREDIFPSGFSGELELKAKPEDKTSRTHGHLEVTVELVRVYCVSSKVRPTVKEVVGTEDDAGQDVREATVTVYSAKDLRNADFGPGQGVSDPYCVVEVPGRPKNKLITPTAANTLNPKWEFTGKVPDYRMGDPLSFTVMDEDFLKTDDFLGRATLDGDKLLAGGFSGELKFKEKGSIRVKVLIGPPSQGDKAAPAEEASPSQAKESKESAAGAPATLVEAAEKGDKPAVKRLLASGAPLDATNADGMNVLHICIARRHEDLVARILQQKSKKKLLAMKTLEAKDTPLHLAARDDQKALCLMLVKEGAGVRAKNAAGKTPADLASGELQQWLRGEDPANTSPPWQK